MSQTKEADLLVENKALYEDKEQLSQVNNVALLHFSTKSCARFFPSNLTSNFRLCFE